MHIVYIDDSGDEVLKIFAALIIPATEWQAAFAQVRQWRRDLKASDGVYVTKELHATDFVAGRGRIADKVVTKGRRARIFDEGLRLTVSLPGVQLLAAVFPKDDDERAFERLLNRVNRNMVEFDSQAIVASDKGKEAAYTRLARRMGVFNPIRSKFGKWETGDPDKNIPIERVVEDIVFKDSAQSYFLQLADLCAYALLRRERPLPSKSRYGLDKSFQLLSPILVLEANRSDPEGIIRP